ncbi:MAG: Crp/Fnr family transcriptional regulator [Clostridia bacterium]|nr:Crp/Fnr family transcriptional regulator [Clostridia bacterium]
METCLFESIYIKQFPFWEQLSDSDRETMCRSSVMVKYPKGTTIHDGSECTGIIIVRSGCLRVYMLSDEGKEITLYRLYPGDICILSASCVLNSITFDVFVDAEEESECCIVGGCAFADISERVPQVKIFALETTVSRFSDVMWVMQQILFMSMDRRLAIFLLDECAKNGEDTIKLTHEQIARYMGSAREVVSRMLKYFASEGIVEVSRKGVLILDKAKLRKLSM